MKKTLVALAALASVSAFAQSAVTLSGNLDFAYGHQSGNAVKSTTTVKNSDIVSSTSVIKISAVEDLGGGTKATVQYGIDPRKWANDNATTTSQSLNRDETFVGLAGKYGDVKLGSPNSLGLAAWGAVSPLGTGIGSGFGTGFSAFGNVRYDRSVRYDAPSFGGVTVAVLKAPGASTATASNGVLGAAARNTTEASATYVNGPLAIALVNISQKEDTSSKVKTSSNVIGGQYNLGSTTLYAAYVDGEALTSTTAAIKAKVTRYAVKQSLGNVDLIASYQDAKFTSGSYDGKHDKVTGLRADYNLSKTTAVYAAYEKVSDKTGLILTTGDARNIGSIGLRKSF